MSAKHLALNACNPINCRRIRDDNHAYHPMTIEGVAAHMDGEVFNPPQIHIARNPGDFN